MQKTFLLGLGAAKSGTTWQYDYISRFAAVDTGFRKEYFIWDALTLSAFAHFRAPRDQTVFDRGELARREMQSDTASYFSYFAGLLSRHSVSITGDLSTTYTGLAPETLIRIREGFAERGIRCRVLFMMRDPVERCHSMIRMFQQKKFPQGHLGLDLAQDEDSLLLQYYDTPHCRSLTSYEKTLANICAAGFAAEDTFIGFYETFFTAAELGRFTRFLGLPLDTSQLDRRSNTTRRLTTLSEDTRTRVAVGYAQTYRSCRASFPHLAAVWPGFAVLGTDVSA